MNIKSTFIAAATAAMVIFAAPSIALAQAAPGGNAGGSASGGGGGGGGNDGGGEGGTYGFGSAYHNIETGEYSCDYLRKRAQWSDSYYGWRKHSRCVAATGS